jgi:hypothetical protein
MKRTYYALLIASAFGLPSLSHADTATAPITRAQVRAELIAAEQADQYPRGYANYPDPVPNYALKHAADRAAADSSYGPESTGHSASGFAAIRLRAAAHDDASSFEDVYRGRK